MQYGLENTVLSQILSILQCSEMKQAYWQIVWGNDNFSLFLAMCLGYFHSILQYQEERDKETYALYKFSLFSVKS